MDQMISESDGDSFLIWTDARLAPTGTSKGVPLGNLELDSSKPRLPPATSNFGGLMHSCEVSNVRVYQDLCLLSKCGESNSKLFRRVKAVVSARDQFQPDLCASMSRTHPKYEIYRSASYWREVHRARRRARQADRAAGIPAQDDTVIDFFPHPKIVTVSSDRSVVFYSRVAPSGCLVPDPVTPTIKAPATAMSTSASSARPAGSLKRQRILWDPPTAGHLTHALSTSSARLAQEDADLVARLTKGREGGSKRAPDLKVSQRAGGEKGGNAKGAEQASATSVGHKMAAGNSNGRRAHLEKPFLMSRGSTEYIHSTFN
ncbi:hypothetical protein B0H12DRAFT_1069917 [Mycena haematopus]|nr:hypothetical protein B0H12DRAFT_1069917 [Mycena haematopus]